MNLLADVPENEFPRVFRCTKRMSAWNYDGSSKDKPHNVSDLFYKRTTPWIEFWEKNTGQKRKKCSYEKCTTNSDLCGGHIWLAGQGGSPYKLCYIAPICKACNDNFKPPNRERGSGSHLEKDTLVVRIRRPVVDEISDKLRMTNL